jgi:hypothetical protein
MAMPHINYLAVLVSGIVIFMLGGLWYSPVLFARPWVRLMGKTEEELKATASGPASYVIVFVCALLSAFALAVILDRFSPVSLMTGVMVAVLCWVGFAAATSFGTALFSGTPRGLWLINSAYNLVALIAAGIILSLWR